MYLDTRPFQVTYVNQTQQDHSVDVRLGPGGELDTAEYARGNIAALIGDCRSRWTA
jgi:hypothetical protein